MTSEINIKKDITAGTQAAIQTDTQKEKTDKEEKASVFNDNKNKQAQNHEQGSTTWAAIKGFFSGAKDGICEYYSDKYEGTNSIWDGTKRTLSLVDDGWNHVKDPIKEWSKGIDAKVNDGDDKNMSALEKTWAAAKFVGSIADYTTTGEGVAVGIALGGALKGVQVVGSKVAPTVASKVAPTVANAVSKLESVSPTSAKVVTEGTKVAVKAALPTAGAGLTTSGAYDIATAKSEVDVDKGMLKVSIGAPILAATTTQKIKNGYIKIKNSLKNLTNKKTQPTFTLTEAEKAYINAPVEVESIDELMARAENEAAEQIRAESAKFHERMKSLIEKSDTKPSAVPIVKIDTLTKKVEKETAEEIRTKSSKFIERMKSIEAKAETKPTITFVETNPESLFAKGEYNEKNFYMLFRNNNFETLIKNSGNQAVKKEFDMYFNSYKHLGINPDEAAKIICKDHLSKCPNIKRFISEKFGMAELPKIPTQYRVVSKEEINNLLKDKKITKRSGATEICLTEEPNGRYGEAGIGDYRITFKHTIDNKLTERTHVTGNCQNMKSFENEYSLNDVLSIDEIVDNNGAYKQIYRAGETDLKTTQATLNARLNEIENSTDGLLLE